MEQRRDRRTGQAEDPLETPSQTGAYEVTITATDLAGNFSTAHGTITLSKH